MGIRISVVEQKYRPDIDGLRATAILLVIGYHAFPLRISGGFVGVDVFFVISGFLISGLITKGIDSGKFSIGDFYSRRIRRIFPALATVLLAVLIAGLVLFLPDELSQLKESLLGSAFFVANIQLWLESGYFDTAAALKPLLHIWSLGIEEQFYLLWPATLLVIWRFRNVRLYLIASLMLASFLLNIAFVEAYPSGTFYLPVTRFWELLLGSLTVCVYDRIRLYHSVRQLLAACGLAMVLSAAFLFSNETPFPGWAALLPTVGTAAIIVAGPSAWLNQTILSHPATVYIGLISYPLYLWHWPLLSIARIEMSGDLAMSGTIRLVLVIVAFVLAVLTYEFVEKPIRFHTKKQYASVGLVSAMLLVCSAALIFVPIKERAARQVASISGDELQWEYRENKDCTTAFPWHKKHGWWFCFANSKKPPELVILGDSHANQFYPGLAKAFPQLPMLSIGTCPPTVGLRPLAANTGESPCAGIRKQEQEQFLRDLISSTPSIRYAILAAYWPSFTASGDEADYWTGRRVEASFDIVPEEKHATQRDKFRHALERNIEFLISRGITPIIFLGTPLLPYDVRACLARPLIPASKNCVVPSETAKQVQFRVIADQLRTEYPSLLVFDPTAAFCDQVRCSMLNRSEVYMRDDNHLSVTGSIRVARLFSQWIRQTLPSFGSDSGSQK